MSKIYTDNDLLERKEFVKKIITVTEIQSKNRKNACYAIDGRWGIGKSYVLEMYKEQLKMIYSDGTEEKNKYIIFQYNCWKYDYYEEPLLAIVATLLDTLAEENGEVSPELSARITGVLKEIGKGLLAKGEEYIKDKVGIDTGKIRGLVQEGVESGTKDFKDSRDFDKYIGFKSNLQLLKNTICGLTKDKTVIFMVDELDRCLPEYAIKVLERLHHVFDEIPNMQVVLSIDKTQLGQTVKKIFGDDTDVNKYLGKFIDFDLKLEEGTFNDRFDIKFEYYLKHFDYQDSVMAPSIAEFKEKMLEGIDIRNRIAIINRCSLLHNILTDDEAIYDFSLMCLEVFLELVHYHEIDVANDSKGFRTSTLFSKSNKNQLPNFEFGLGYIRGKYVQAEETGPYYNVIDRNYHFVRCNDVWGLILGCYRYILGHKNDEWKYSNFSKTEYCEYAKKYWDLLQIIN